MSSLESEPGEEVNLKQALIAERKFVSLLDDHIRTQEARVQEYRRSQEASALAFERTRNDYTVFVKERHQHAVDEIANLTLRIEQMKSVNLFRGMAIGGSFIGLCSFAAFLVYIFIHL